MPKTFPCTYTSIPLAVEFVRQTLEERKFDNKVISKVLLRFEDIIQGMILKADDPSRSFSVSVQRKYRLLGKVSIVVRCRGSVLSIDDVVPKYDFDDLEPETVQILNRNLQPMLSRGLSLRYRSGRNIVTLEVGNKKINGLAVKMLTLLGGILFGILLRLILPQQAVSFIAAEILGTCVTIFFNLLKMIVAPLVFFSIVTSISGFSDLGEFGSTGIKTIALFVFFSIIALLIGYGVFTVLPSGDPAMQVMIDCPVTTAAVESTSSLAWQNTKSFLLSIFPANLLGPFVENNVLAVIFIAVLIGITLGKVKSEEAVRLSRAFETGNELITKLTSAITGTMPVLIFCSLAKLVMTVNLPLLATLARYLLAMVIGCLLMIGFYLIAMLICGISPITFLKGYSPALVTGFTMASSTATVPVALDCCVSKLKLPKSIAYFVIPLGSTINMSGSCIVLLVSCLMLANVFAIEITFVRMIPAMLMLLLLAMAAPGVPGSMVIMLATVLPVIGVPAEAANVTVWFSAIIGMFMVPTNCMGDAVTAAIISHQQAKKKVTV